MNTVVYLVPHAPPIDFERKYFVRELHAKGFRILYWDVGRLMGYNVKIEATGFDSVMTSTLVHDKAHLRDLIAHEVSVDTIFVPQITPSLESRPVFDLLHHYGAKTAFFGRGYLPLVSEPKGQRKRLMKTLFESRDKIFVIRRFWRALRFRLTPPAKALDLIFTAGQLAEEIHANGAKSIVRIHHFDIDMTKEVQERDRGSVPDACVFIDDYLPFHPDFAIGGASRIDPSLYFQALNAFFSEVEEVTGRPVLIAAHPKAIYEQNPFGGRKVFFGKTHSLVENAHLVITHGSTAVSYAVLFDKPILLISSDDIRKTHDHLHSLMERTSELLDCPLIDFTRPEASSAIRLTTNSVKYADYRKRFLSNSDDPRSSSDIVVSTFQDMLR